ncbi:MAG: hypothetical protein J6Y35_01260 [Bacteroidales bacterium]|nr:hypothetical protein [Bacteroidales bacterium]
MSKTTICMATKRREKNKEMGVDGVGHGQSLFFGENGRIFTKKHTLRHSARHSSSVAH